MALLNLSGKIRIGKRLSMKHARAVNTARQIVARGLVDTGSGWDGWHIRDVYRAIRQHRAASDRAAYDLTRAIWQNRVAAYRAGKVNYQATIRVEEPWAYEPESGYFVDYEEDKRE